MKKEMEQKSSMELEELRKSMENKAEDEQVLEIEAPREREFEEMEVQGPEEVQNPQISSQEDVGANDQRSDLSSQNSERAAGQGGRKKSLDTRGNDGTLTPDQKREEDSPRVVTITRENKNRVSFEHKGLLINPNGTMSRTPQYDTWNRNPNMQLMKLYDTNPRMPEEVEGENHPGTSRLGIGWTHEGEWVLVPTFRTGGGIDYRNCKDARLEKYIDMEGNIRRAICYGNEAEKLKV